MPNTTQATTTKEREANRCPRCLSADTVGYWDKPSNDPNVIRRTITAVYQSHYPNARKCIDCEQVWW